MFGKKISKEDLGEIRKRNELVNQYVLIAQALELQKNVYLRNIFPKYGLDVSQDYEINLRTGRIIKIKSKQLKQ